MTQGPARQIPLWAGGGIGMTGNAAADAFKMICLRANGVILGKILVQLLGCVGSEHGRCNACNTGKCPQASAPQDPRLVKRLDVDRGPGIVDYAAGFDAELRKLLAPMRQQLPASGTFDAWSPWMGGGRQAEHPVCLLTSDEEWNMRGTVRDHERMSRDLLLSLEGGGGAGRTDFHIQASGQHDIGRSGTRAESCARSTNPGQRSGLHVSAGHGNAWWKGRPHGGSRPSSMPGRTHCGARRRQDTAGHCAA